MELAEMLQEPAAPTPTWGADFNREVAPHIIPAVRRFVGGPLALALMGMGPGRGGTGGTLPYGAMRINDAALAARGMPDHIGATPSAQTLAREGGVARSIDGRADLPTLRDQVGWEVLSGKSNRAPVLADLNRVVYETGGPPPRMPANNSGLRSDVPGEIPRWLGRPRHYGELQSRSVPQGDPANYNPDPALTQAFRDALDKPRQSNPYEQVPYDRPGRANSFGELAQRMRDRKQQETIQQMLDHMDMVEAATRRNPNLLKEPRPDLKVIDGGLPPLGLFPKKD